MKENLSLGLAYSFRERSHDRSGRGTWRQTERHGAGAIAKSLHVIFKIEAERERERDTDRQSDRQTEPGVGFGKQNSSTN